MACPIVIMYKNTPYMHVNEHVGYINNVSGTENVNYEKVDKWRVAWMEGGRKTTDGQ